MNISKIFEQCSEQGVELNSVDGDLEVLFNEPPTDDLIDLLRANKPQIIAFLENQNSSEEVATAQLQMVPRDGNKFKLSYAQQRLWFIDTLEGQSVQYNLPSTVRLTGGFSTSAAKQAMQYIVDRHEILRTVYREEGGVAYQLIRQKVQFKLSQFSLSDVDKQRKAAELIARENSRSFNLGEDLMIRACYIQLSQNEGLLAFNMHHIATDGWSMSILIKEFAKCYSDIISGNSPQLPALAIQYLDYAYWQRDMLQGEGFDAQLQYWKNQLASVPLVHSLPLDYTRPPIKQNAGKRITRTVSAYTAQCLEQLASDNQLTSFMLLHGALSLVLSRHSNSQDIVIATPVSNRKRVEFESLIGFFANTMVLRLNTDFDALPDYFEHVRQVHLDAQSNQDIPFEKLVDQLNIPRSRAYNPVVQILLTTSNSFALEGSSSSDELVLGNVSFVPVPQEQVITKFDLEVNTSVSDQGIELNFDYDTSIFDAKSIEQLAEHLSVLLNNLAHVAQSKIDNMSLASVAMMTAQEQQQLISGFHTIQVDYQKDACLHELFEAQVKATPERTALVFEGTSLTYQQLNERANQVAHCLREEYQVTPETLVGLYMQRSIEMVVGLLGILKAGGAYVPLEPTYPKSRMDYFLSDTGIKVLLAHTATISRFEGQCCKLLNLEDGSFADFSRGNLDKSTLGLTSQNLAYVIYTSGSTGKPKGVMLEHHSVVNRIQWMENQFKLQSTDVILQKTPFSFDVSVWEFFWPLSVGAKLVMARPEGHKDPIYLQEIIRKEGATVIHFVPSMLRSMLEAKCLDACDSLRYVFCSGEALTADIIQSFNTSTANAQMHNLYGPTEASIDVSSWDCSQYDGKSGLVPIGKAIQNVKFYVLDSQMNLLPQGSVGELYIGGVAVGRGYLNNPERTAENFVKDPFADTEGTAYLYKTGDLVRYLPDGNLAYLGRADDQVKINGFRIELGEIEFHLSQCAELASAFVVEKTFSSGQKKLVGYFNTNDDINNGNDLINSIKGQLQKVLPDFMVPAYFVEVQDWPLSANGKIDKSRLPDVAELNRSEGTYTAPQTDVEKQLCQVWSSLLNVENVSVHDNFFDLGGDSILSIQAVSRSRALGFHFTVAQQFENQTIAQLARVVSVESKVEISQAPCEGEMELLPIQSSFFAQNLQAPNHFNQAAFLEVPGNIEDEFWYQLVEAVYCRHDALRLVFAEVEGEWQGQFQQLSDELIKKSIVLIDMSQFSSVGSSDEDRKSQLEQECSRLQQSLSLQQGPLFKLCYFNYGPETKGRLLIVCHHLVIDGVSWRVLLKDFEQASQQYAQNQNIQLDPKTSSLPAWRKKLVQYAENEALPAEKSYWVQVLKDLSNQTLSTYASKSSEQVTVSSKMVLDSDNTQSLLLQCNKRFKTHINELLLSCLLRASQQWIQLESLPLSIESHGREPLFDDVDITETLGWFTSVYPLVLKSEGFFDEPLKEQGSQFSKLIQDVKSQYRKTPKNGIGYGALWALAKDPDLVALHNQTYHQSVLFNYQSKTDSAFDSEQGFAIAQESSGTSVSEQNQLSHLLHIDGAVLDGELTFTLASQRFEQVELDRLSVLFQKSLRDAAAFGSANNDTFVAPLTPEDFPNARLSLIELNDIHVQNADISRLYVATPLQRGMLYHSMLDKTGTQYTTVSHSDFSGHLEVEHFKKALQTVIDRHDVLRTCFVGLDLDVPHQLVKNHASAEFEVMDWQDQPDEIIEASLINYRLQEKARGVDYSKAPLMRFALILLPGQRYHFVWVYHHLLLDGWCLPVLFNEVIHCYQSLLQGKVDESNEVIPYENFVSWCLQQDQNAAIDYWREQLKGVTSTAKLVDESVGVGAENFAQKDQFAQERLLVGDDLQAKLGQLAKSNQCTVNVIMQFAWSFVLAKYSNSNDVIIGTTVSGRPADLVGIEKILGLFINTIPARTVFDDEQTISNALKARHAQNVHGEAFSYLSLARVQQLAGLPAGEELFDTLFVFENYPSIISVPNERGQQNSLRIDSVSALEHSNYPLTVIVTAQDKLAITLDYKTQHFSRKTISQVMKHYRNVLNCITEVGDSAKVKELTMLSASEKQRIFQQLQGQAVELPKDKCIHELFEQQAKAIPNKVAVEFGEEQLSYEQLNHQANQVAHCLLAAVKAEPSLQSSHNQLSIGVCFERSLDMLVAIVGILKAGFHYVPLDPEYPTNRLEIISRNANMFRVLTCGNVADKLSTLDCEVLVFSAMDLANYSTSNIPLQEAGINSNSIAYSIYTSGSTGVPKGVALRHRNAVAMLTGAYHEYSEAELSRVLFSTSLNFDLSVFEMFLPLCFGYQCVMVKSILSLLEQEIRVSLVATVPSAIKTLLESDGIPSDVKVITLGGEALGANVVNGLLDNGHCQKVVNIYGPTEDTTYSTSSAYTSRTHVAPNIGRIVPNAQGYILSPDLTPVPYGATGELYMSGAGVTAGYVNSESLTEQRFLKNPFYEPALDDSYQVMYKTGDLVKLLPDGNLAFVCREDEQVKVNGVRIELGEIEHALSRCDGVDSAVVMARQLDAADRLNNQLVAFIKTLQFADADFDEKTLINQTKDALIAVLPSTMLPNRFVVLEDWPLNPNGKIDKNQLAKTYSSLVQNNSQSTKKSTARSDQYETKLLEIWEDLLQLQDIGLDEGFFDVGGNSLTIVSMVNRLNKQFGVTIQLTDAFAYPTISSLANYLRDLVAPADLHNKLSIDSGNNNLPENEPKKNDDPIAIIGMAGQFPDARDIAEFWHNIETGRESLQTFTREQLTEAGYVDKQLNDPYFVSKGVIHQNVKEFDADFFGFTPRQAEIMDPQQRMLFEATQHTLDDAGYGDTDIPQKIGVFVGCSDSQYLFNNIIPNIELMTSLYQEVAQSNSNTYSASRLAFKFNLTGPAVSVATACSTSLVAIHQAITSIQSGDCEMALAGGSSVANLGPAGYHFQEGNIASEDGHCRAFDDSASGTRSGNGVGMLLLKPLSKALEDGDQVHAVIKGTAINNDGHVKIGYTAPSVAGQSEVIAKALQKAKVKPAQVQYIETHGTGTRLGDPIEIRALNKVFQSQISNSIALGTLKPNIGHTDIAAGVAGVIKTVAAIKARKMPKCINFEKPNQEIDFANSPFYINTETKDWPEIDDTRTASISSFGIGGTNAHAVIQQAPKLALAQEAPVQNWHQPQLLLLSANSEASLKQMSAELADYIATDQAASLSDIAYTLQVGRKRLPFRQYYVVASKEQAVEQLRSGQDHCAVRSQYKNADVYFMFSGQGTQYEGMAKDLYQSETIFRKVMDRCAAQIKAHLSIDILDRIYPKKRTQEEKYAHSINDTLVTQPALFAIEYSLAQLLMSWGVKPAGAIGHSLGEYVAATVAGVFSLEDAIRLVCKRAEIMQKIEPGAMVSVVLNETECQALADEYACDLAAVNAPDRCVISGALHAIDALQAEFESNDIVHTRLKTSHAFHSRMMDPVLKEFNAVLSDIQMSSPRLPVISNVTGQYLTDDLVSSSDYWVDHLRGTIKFGAGLDTLLTDANKNNSCFVEVGLGNILCQLGQLASSGGSARFVPSLKGVNSTEDDHSVLQALLGELWKQGVSIDWRNISGNEANRKVSLPPYPFDRKIHWIEASRNNRPAAVEVDCLQAKDAVEQWLYEPVWNAVVKNGRNNLKGSVQQSVEAGELDKSCLIFEDRAGISRQIGEQIKAQGITPIYVAQSDEYQRLSATQYQLVAGDKSGFMQLASDMTQDNYAPSFILHGWLIDDNLIDDAEQCSQQLNDELLSLLHLCQALDENGIVQDVKLTVLSNKTQYFDEDDVVQPGKAGLLGVCRVIPAEYRNMDFQSIDIELTDQGQLVGKKALSKLVDCIVSSSRILHRTMCLRGNQLWHQSYEQLQKPESEEQSHSQALLKNDGVYVITGGLSGIGVSLAEHIAASVKAKLVLVGRSEFVARESWDNWIAEHGTGEQTSQAIARIRAMENHGSEVLIMQADATLRSDVAALKDRVQQEFGLVDGIIHSAGVPGSGLMSLKTPEMIAAVLKPKVLGTLLLAEAFENDQPDFFVNCSSLAPVVGGVGQYEYCAANAFQDAFSYAQQSSNTRFISINWDSWSQVGMAVKAVNKMSNSNSPIVHIKDAMTPEEGKQVFDLILRKSQPQVIVSRNEINARVKHIEELMKTQEVEVIKPTGLLEDDRPVLNIKYVEPKFALEIGLAEIWSSVLGIERIGVDDHFFDLGGDSLLLSGIVTRINKKWDVRFPLKTAFEKPTIKEMTQSLATHINVAAESDLDDCEYEEEVI